MKAVVLGGTGFLGSSICHALVCSQWDVVSVARGETAPGCLPDGVRSLRLTLPDPALREVLTAHAPDVIVFSVGSPTVGAAQANPANEFQLSVAAVQSTLEALRSWGGPCRFILISSAAVYGEGHGRILDETSPKAPMSFYGYSKLMGETLVQAYQTQYGIKTISLRPFSVFGEKQKKQVVFDLATRMLAGAPVIEIAGKGSEERDFILADDFASIVAKVANDRDFEGVLNIGSGEATTIAVLAREIAKRLSPQVEIRFSDRRIVGNPISLVACTKKARRLGLSVPSRLGEGLDSLCTQLLEQKNRKVQC